MLNNLKAEMIRYGIKSKDFAEALNVREATISSKMNGKTPFSVDEAIKLQELYFPHYATQLISQTKRLHVYQNQYY